MSSDSVQNPLAVLIIPGMTDRRETFSPIIMCLQTEGYICRFLEPDGYGINGEETDWKVWLRQSRDAVLDMKKQNGTVYALGHSAGGLLSVVLGEEHLVDGVVSLAAPLFFRKDSLRPVKKWQIFRKKTNEKDPEGKGIGCREYTFSARRVRNLHRLAAMTLMNLGQLQCPILVAQGDEDPFSEWESLEQFRESCRSVYMEQATPDGCLDLSLETESQKLKEDLLDFLAKSEEMRRSAETKPIVF